MWFVESVSLDLFNRPKVTRNSNVSFRLFSDDYCTWASYRYSPHHLDTFWIRTEFESKERVSINSKSKIFYLCIIKIVESKALKREPNLTVRTTLKNVNCGIIDTSIINQHPKRIIRFDRLHIVQCTGRTDAWVDSNVRVCVFLGNLQLRLHINGFSIWNSSLAIECFNLGC